MPLASDRAAPLAARTLTGYLEALNLAWMRQTYRNFLGFLLAAPLAGCAVMSAADMAVLVLSMPGPARAERVELSGYSLGPGSSDEATGLILEAIPPEEGTVHFTGRVEWTGLSNLRQSVFTVNQSMAAITDFNILFLWWSEAIERYEVLIRLPLADIYSVELWTPGFATNVRLCHEQDEVPVGDEVLAIDRKTTLRILGSGGFVDAEETRAVFTLLDTQFIAKSESPDLQDPCDEAAVPGEVSPTGFGNCDPAVEEC